MIPMLVFRKFLPYIAIVVAIGGVYYFGYSKGVDKTVAVYEARMVEERTRLTAANEAALVAAATREVELAQELRERDDTITNLVIEAAADPHAARPAISSSGVQRLNRVR